MDSHGSPDIWKAFIHLLVRDRRGLEVLSVASFIKANLNPTPSASSAGTSGLRVRNHQICRVFCEKHRRPGVPAFVVRNLWSSGVHVESDSLRMIPKTLQFLVVRRTRQSPQSPCWLRGLRTSVLWHDVVEICLTLDYHCWIFGLFFIFHLSIIAWNCDMFFLTKWQDDVIAMSKLARDPAMYLALWLWSCSVSPCALTFRVKVVR